MCYCVFFFINIMQSSSAYVLFYQRRTEGRPVNILDRSLSQSFADEKKILSSKYTRTPNTVEEEMASDNEVCIYLQLSQNDCQKFIAE